MRAVWMAVDALCWIVAVVATMNVRPQPVAFELLPGAWVPLTAAAVQLGAGLFLGPYLVPHVRGSYEEVASLVRTSLLSGIALFLLAVAVPALAIPTFVPLLATAQAVVLMLAARLLIRSYRGHRAGRRNVRDRVIVLGAGVAGRRLVDNMIRDDASHLRPVAVLDDERAHRRMRIEGVPVHSTDENLVELARRTSATHLVVAVPHIEPDELRALRARADAAHLKVKVLPPLGDWVREEPSAVDLRDINLEDLLGRRAVQLDQCAIRRLLEGKVVLVTGAGGSIGSELCRQIAEFGNCRLVMLDRDESALHWTQMSIAGHALLDRDDLVLADIRDGERLMRRFAEVNPDVVIHTAALKHLSLLERYPEEAWSTNVQGTLNVLRASAAVGVRHFVNISTDKAADPTSVLGYAKRVGERLTAHYSALTGQSYVSVRFGNVLGSRGSVIPAFTEQIRRGGPVTVTHPDIERYFMLIPEACQLVLQASTLEHDGQAMVLDMGRPVRIADVAREMIRISGEDVKIEFTGLRPGEKLKEDLFFDWEACRVTRHPLIRVVDVPGLAPEDLPEGPADGSNALVTLRGLCAERGELRHT